MKTLFALSLLILLSSLSCNRKCEKEYTFDFPISVSPVKEVYDLGDTIWFEIQHSAALTHSYYDGQNGEYDEGIINLSNYNFPPFYFDFIKVEDPSLGIFNQNFNTMTLVDSLIESGLVMQQRISGALIKPFFLDGYYQLKIGIVCNTAGNYVFLPAWKEDHNDYFPYEMTDRIDYSCSTEFISNIRFPVNEENVNFMNNYHLFETVFFDQFVYHNTNHDLYSNSFSFTVQ